MVYLGVGEGVEETEGQVLELLLYRTYAEAVRYRSVDVHGLERGSPLLLYGTIFQRPHVVEAVCELDYHYSDILRHREEYLSDILRLLFLLGVRGDLAQLCDAVNEHRNVLTEALFEVVERGGSVLYNVMEQSRANGIGVHAELEQYIRDCERVYDVVLTRRALLSLMSLRREFISGDNLAHVVLLVVLEYLLDYFLNGEILVIVGDRVDDLPC